MKTPNDIPKRKPNHFFVYNIKACKYDEIKYISQYDLAEGYRQILPKCNSKNIKKKKLINHFSITLCFLPEYLWKELKYDGENYKVIQDGITLYSIVETNQDEIMKNLYNEIIKRFPNKLVINHLINELDESQYSSWLILRSKKYLNTGKKFEPNYIENITPLATPIKLL
jgi:hypothetical protein